MKNQNWMTLWNDTGLRPLADLRLEMDRLFDDYWTTTPAPKTLVGENHFTPACDVAEEKDHFLLNIEMPGIGKNDVKLEVIDNQLIVSGERHQDRKNNDSGAWYSERRYGKFKRSFALPAGVDADKVEALHEDGILRIYVPKAESAKPRQIKIANGKSTSFFGKLIGQQSSNDQGKEKVAS